MIKREQVLVLNPASEIKFKGPYTEVVTRSLTLTNPSEQKVAFKIKTTTPKRYCVRPNSGTLSPGETASVSIMLQPHDQDADKAKHKFMVQSIFLSNSLPEGPIDNYWKTATAESIMDTKLKCVFEDDDSPKKPVVPKHSGGTGDLEKSFKADVSMASAQGEAPQAQTTDPARLWDEIQELRIENDRLKKEGLRYRNVALDQSFTTASKLHASGESAYRPSREPEQGLMRYRQAVLMLLMVLMGILLGKILF